MLYQDNKQTHNLPPKAVSYKTLAMSSSNTLPMNQQENSLQNSLYSDQSLWQMPIPEHPLPSQSALQKTHGYSPAVPHVFAALRYPQRVSSQSFFNSLFSFSI